MAPGFGGSQVSHQIHQVDQVVGPISYTHLSGVTSAPEVETFPYRPDQVLTSVADLVPMI